MDPKDVFEKVDKKKLQAALASDDPDALKELLAAEGIALTGEQLDYISGGVFGLNTLGDERDR